MSVMNRAPGETLNDLDRLARLVDAYDPRAPLSLAWTIPSSWYVDAGIMDLERRTVFDRNWQMVGRVDQVQEPGQYLTGDVAGEPLVIVRGKDGVLRGFFNVCRHHAAQVMTEPCGTAAHLRCPYHGWTYSLDGDLKGTPDMKGVEHFELAQHGLVPVATATWENWVFVRLSRDGLSLEEFLTSNLIGEIQPFGLSGLHWM